MVAQNSQFRVANAQNNPGLASLGKIIQFAMEKDIKKGEVARQEASDIRKAGVTAVFNKYPGLAAKQLGMDTTGMTQPGQVPQAPPGTVLDQTTIDESGNQVSKFVNPAQNPPSGGPSWGQEQKVSALKTGLRMGKVVIVKEFGEPSVYEAKTMEDALKAIQDAGLSPSLFADELQLYDVVEQRKDKKSGRVMQKLKDGRVIWQDTKEPIS